jgi:hypothetical protein
MENKQQEIENLIEGLDWNLIRSVNLLMKQSIPDRLKNSGFTNPSNINIENIKQNLREFLDRFMTDDDLLEGSNNMFTVIRYKASDGKYYYKLFFSPTFSVSFINLKKMSNYIP